MVWAAWLVGPPELVIATTGAVVSSVKLSEAVRVLPNVSVWLANDGVRTIGQPARRERHAPCAWRSAVAATGLPSIVKCTTVLARPVRSAHHWR